MALWGAGPQRGRRGHSASEPGRAGPEGSLWGAEPKTGCVKECRRLRTSLSGAESESHLYSPHTDGGADSVEMVSGRQPSAPLWLDKD
ncbi:unnamed protein product [Gadus morhua 'NCC']